MVIAVLDHVAHCNTSADGDALYVALRRALALNAHVTVSFAGVHDVPSSFINASIVRLVEDHGIDAVKARLSIQDVGGQVGDMIRRCVRNASRTPELA